MRVLVTGGSGNVGRVVCRRLATEHEVVNFDRVPSPEPVGRWLRGDVLSYADLSEAVMGMDAVVHLAAIASPAYDSSDAVMMANVMGTQRVVQAAALGSPRRLVMASSESSYGFVFSDGKIRPRYLPIDEDHPACPADPYGLSKLLGEEICRRYTRSAGLETVCLRYCWVWGEAEYANMRQWSRNPDGFVGQLWGYVDVRDVAEAVARSLTAPEIEHETLLIAGATTFQSRPSLDLAREFLRWDIDLREAAWFAANPRRSLLDCRRAAQRIGWRPQHDCWQEAGLNV